MRKHSFLTHREGRNALYSNAECDLRISRLSPVPYMPMRHDRGVETDRETRRLSLNNIIEAEIPSGGVGS